MATRYDLLDNETGNLYGRFQSEDQALRFVRGLMDANGPDIVESMVLGGRDDDGHVIPAETGEALARRALAAAPDRLPVVART